MRVVFTSTIAIFGERDDPTVKDDTKLRPLNTYGPLILGLPNTLKLSLPSTPILAIFHRDTLQP